MPQPRDWTIALHDLLVQYGQGAACLLCGTKPVRYMDLVDLSGHGMSYVLCGDCRAKDPEAQAVHAVLRQRYAQSGRRGGAGAPPPPISRCGG